MSSQGSSTGKKRQRGRFVVLSFNNLAPTSVSNFSAKRQLWLFNKGFSQQTISPSQKTGQYDIEAVYASIDDKALNPTVSLDPLPSSPKEKRDLFLNTLTSILSCIYSIFIITLGIVIYLADMNSGTAPMAELFSIYLVVVGLFYFCFLYSDIRKYLRLLKISEDVFSNRTEVSLQNNSRGQHMSVVWSSLPEANLTMPHYYCFSQGRHSGSFYLKVGAAGFCLGHLIHHGLLISYQLAFLITDPHNFYRCASVATLVLDLLYPTYSFVQLFFIFKYSNVIINRFKVLGRFAIMHCIGSSLCFWIWTILRETIDSMYDKDEYHKSLHHNNAYTDDLLTDVNGTNLTTGSLVKNLCLGPKQFKNVFESFSPYLYPFTIEYSILVVGVLFVIWQNIGSFDHCSSNRKYSDFMSNVVIYADCHSSNKGLFGGLIVLAGAFLSIILFFVAMTDRNYIEVGLSVNAITEVILLFLMTGAALLAYNQITKLDVNSRAVSLLDELLLYACIPAFFLQTILTIIPSWTTHKYLNMTSSILQVVQVLSQTPFIFDGLRRCSNSKQLRVEKPGRELLTFLIVCNVAMWITETFEIKSHSASNDPRAAYYGRLIWTSVSHMTFPLTMFYRFHSSVCMVDIWKSAYTKDY